MKGSLTWKLSNCVMAVFLALASYVQHNDEYPVWWMLVYAVPCLVCLTMVADCKSLHSASMQRMLYFLLLGYFLFSLYLFTRGVRIVIDTGDIDLLAHQETKEMFGVLIVETWLLLCTYFVNARLPFDALMTRVFKWSIVILSLSPIALWLYHGCFGQSTPNVSPFNFNLTSTNASRN